ncbi:hypothetical protein [Nocardioides caldifontis]|uniref:hypothetical protein n=1 Tax=Nocardioides caldifontis TaxID=2588938 RepID=UPI0011E03A9C|nr:hypothetical protein [Nocardioides caldifontis]
MAALRSDVHAGDDLDDRATPLSGTQLELHGHSVPVPRVLSPWTPFGDEWEFPQLLLGVLSGHEVTEEVLIAYDRGRPSRVQDTPASDSLELILTPAARRFAIGDAELQELFFRAEILISALIKDWETASGTAAWGLAEHWIGGHTKIERYATSPLPERMLQELENASHSWWPLQGGAFGGSFERAQAALQAYVELAVEARSRRRL